MKRHLYTSFWAVVSVCMLISQYGFADSPASKTKLKAAAWVSSTNNSFTESETKEPGLSKTIPGSFPPIVCTATFTASISVASSTICVGTAVQLSSVASAQASGSYSWAFSGAGAFSGTTQPPTSRTPNYVPSGSGISSFTLTVLRSTGCSATATATVSATQPTVLAGVQSPVGTICLGSTINLTASGGDTYSWRKNGNATIQQDLIDAGFVSTSQNPSYTASATNLGGTFTVTATATNSCTNTTTMTLSIQALPAAEIKTQPDNDPVPATICKGGTLTLRANPGPNSNTYSWQGSDSFTSAIRTPMVTFSTTGTKNYTVTVTATTGCSNTATASIEVLELPDPAVSPPQTVCTGTPVNLTAATGMSSYSWVSSSGGFTSASNMLSLVANDVTPGTNYFTVTVTATTGCSATATTSLSVNALPTFALSYLYEVCLGATISLEPIAYLSASYSWNIGHNGSFTTSTANPLYQTYTSPGYYYYTVTAMNTASCTYSLSVEIHVGPDIQPRYAPICLQGNPLSLSASGGGSYSWAGPNGFSSTLASPTPKAWTPANLGIYTVTVTSGINTCTATATVEVYFGAGTITATSPVLVCKGGTLQLAASATHGASYRWTKLGSSTVWLGPNPTVTTNMKATNAGLYTVWITGVNGCIAKQEVLVTMKLCIAPRLAADMSGEAEEDIKLTLSENPTNGRMKVSVTLAQESKVQLDWINLNGTKLHGWESSNNQTVHEFDIDVSTSVDGLYLLRASTDTGQKTLRVVKSSDK